MPGAAAMGPGGTSGQLRPPVSMVPGAGRGRGDWRPTGVKGPPAMQKGFHPGYGMPIWGSGASGRGLEFTLPSHKYVYFDEDTGIAILSQAFCSFSQKFKQKRSMGGRDLELKLLHPPAENC